MSGLGLSSLINLASMAYSAINMNRLVNEQAKSMDTINAEIDGGKATETDEVTADNKMKTGENFLKLAGPKQKKTQEDRFGSFNAGTYF